MLESKIWNIEIGDNAGLFSFVFISTNECIDEGIRTTNSPFNSIWVSEKFLLWTHQNA